MNTFPRSRKEWLKDQIDRMDVNEHTQLLTIIKKYTDQFTKTNSGILISTDNMTDECLTEIEKYVTFSIDQRKRIDEDLKTRKTFERMMHD
jgi:hypothetical protein